MKDLNVSVVTICLHVPRLQASHDLQQPFFFSNGATLALTRISFKLLALLNLITGTLSRTSPCSLPHVNSKCILDSIVLNSFKISEHWMIAMLNKKHAFISYTLFFA